MFTFTFDQYFYFDRPSHDDQWYAYTHMQQKPFFHGYFNASDARFAGTPEDGHEFNPQQIQQIEQLLVAHKSEMGLEQFEAHKIRPPHYKRLAPTSQPCIDIIRRLRVHGDYDPDVSVAYETLCLKDPAYRLTRDFVRQVLEEAPRVTTKQRDEWLDEVVLDAWTYDVGPYAEPGETFESYYQSVLDGLLIPTPLEERENSALQLFAIDGLSKLYLVEETFGSVTDSRYFIDLGPAVVPVPLPGHCGQAYYIL